MLWASTTLIAGKETQIISNYSPFYADGEYQLQNVIIIRSFEQNKDHYFISVDPQTLRTEIIPQKSIRITPETWPDLLKKYASTPYIKALQRVKENPSPLQDAGFIHGFPEERGATLTIDLCPSKKPLDRIIFKEIIQELSKKERPVPVAISITGKFLQKHPSDILWLKALVKSGDISITWINHTYNHHYNKKAALANNFLLLPGTNVSKEILDTEKALLNQGILFSDFFRFPGLISSPRLISQVTDFGLIPIGTDAWLAKGDKIKQGSIVLIHGNGNEPLGVKAFTKLLQEEAPNVTQGNWLLYDLQETIKRSVDDTETIDTTRTDRYIFPTGFDFRNP